MVFKSTGDQQEMNFKNKLKSLPKIFLKIKSFHYERRKFNASTFEDIKW